MKKMLVVMLFVLVGCECEYGEIECDGGVVRACAWNETWRTLFDLDEIEPETFYCEEREDGLESIGYGEISNFQEEHFLQKHITKEYVIALWDHLSEVYGTTVKRRKTKNVQEGKAILVGSTIYVPFEIGVPDKHNSLFQQAVIALHEHQHYADGMKRVKYFLSSSYRAMSETNAYLANLDFRNMFGYRLPLDMMWLKSEYKCLRHDALFGNLAMKIANKMYQLGHNVMLTEVGQEAFYFTRSHMVENGLFDEKTLSYETIVW